MLWLFMAFALNVRVNYFFAHFLTVVDMFQPYLFFITFVFSGFLSSNVSAENGNSTWKPEAVDYDWVQLTSGEWLKGEIKSMYNESLEFDSDKLDLLNIDWEDVQYLKSHGSCHIHFEKYGAIIGVLKISDTKIIISNADEVKTFERKQLVSFTPAGEHEIDLWNIKFGLGLNFSRGNTEQIDYTAKFSAKRRTAESRFLLYYIGNISKTNAVSGTLEETINNHRLSSSLDKYVTREFFYTPIFAEYFRDPFQNIDQRITLGAGLGYSLYDTSRFEWNISAGPAFLSTRYASVQPGGNSSVTTGALAAGTDIDLALSKTLDFIYKYSIQVSKKEAGGYTHYMIATLESEITGYLDLDVSLVWNRISQPTVDGEGNLPKPDDYRLMLGVSYSY